MGCFSSKGKGGNGEKGEDAAPEEEPAAEETAEGAEPKNDAGTNAKKKKADGGRANLTADYMSDDLRDLFNEYYNRYDIDGSGTINTSEELRQLCTNLVVKLDLDNVDAKYIDMRVRDAKPFVGDLVQQGAEKGKNEWDLAAFTEWFLNPDNFIVDRDWAKGDESESDSGEPGRDCKPFFCGTYAGVLSSADGSQKYTVRRRKGVGQIDPETKTYSKYATEPDPTFVLRVRVAQGEGSDGKRQLLARQGCDSVGAYKTHGNIDRQKIHFEMEYDVDNKPDSAEPHLVLDGTVSKDGKTITGTWKNAEPKAGGTLQWINLKGVEKGKFELTKRKRQDSM